MNNPINPIWTGIRNFLPNAKAAVASEATVMGGFYKGAAGNRFQRGYRALNSYMESHPGRFAGTLAAGTAVGMGAGAAIAPEGHRKWGLYGGITGGVLARGIYGRGRR